MIFTACAMAFAHGSNDVANAIELLSAVVGIVKGGAVLAEARIPFGILLLGAAGIVSGPVMYDYRVIATIDTDITQLTLSRCFTAHLATAVTTVVVASASRLPISTT